VRHMDPIAAYWRDWRDTFVWQNRFRYNELLLRQLPLCKDDSARRLLLGVSEKELPE
jgi:hypothetical protein